ncbi:DUF2062 domain-containing protein [Candidatus Woesearchaeota archaeon]|nr:DUF2062 domain-containing protein [Candidatus Woesearchaeota archaeon]
MDVLKRIYDHFHEVVRVHKSPKSIAFGFCLGTLIAVLPTPGISILIGVLLVFLFKNINKFTLFGAMALWNPFTLVPVYYYSYAVGNFILGSSPIQEYKIVMLDQVFHYTKRFLLGNAVIAVIMAGLSYIIVLKISESIIIAKEKHKPNKDKKEKVKK